MKWPNVEMKKVADVASGFGFPRKHQGDTGEEFPFFKVGDMNLPGNEQEMVNLTNSISAATMKKLRAKAFPAGTVIFPKIGAAIATNKKRMLIKSSIVDNNVMGLIPNDQINEWYLYFWMQQFDLRSVSNLGPVPSMRKTTVEKIKIPLPPPSEQRRIVEILDQADRLRKLRAEADKKAERILPALFIKMFGDPATNPMGWETFNLGAKKLLDIKGGGTPSKDNASFWNGTIPWVSPKDMKSEIIEDTLDHVTEEAILQSSTNKVSTNSILLVVRSGILAHSVPIALAGREMSLNQDMKSFSVKDENELNSLFLFGWMKAATSSLIRGCIKFGATVHSIDMTRLGSLKIVKPPIENQNKFALQFQDILSLQSNRMKSGPIIDQLFNTMLHRAFTGDLTASWRQAHMKELLQEMEIQAKALAT